MNRDMARSPGLASSRSRTASRLAGVALAAGLALAPASSAAGPAAGPGAATVPARISALPRGVTLSGLQDWLPRTAAVKADIALPSTRLTTIEAQISAARQFWKANLVRFQIVQDKLVGKSGRAFSPAYMSDIKKVTDFALSQHLTVVLNAQTEDTPGFRADESLPTAATRSFWHHIMAVYANRPQVVFDLFNEPRDCTWAQWHRAMQGLVNSIRDGGARNTIWAEGRWWGSTLAGVPLLHGAGIAYSFHHPGSPWPSQRPVTPATWNRAFGDLASHGVPVVDGEFVNFSGGYHWPHPRVLIPEYLRYLRAHRIGLTAWTLLPGVLTSSRGLAFGSTEPTGDGHMIKAWFNKIG